MKRTTVYSFTGTGMQFEYTEGAEEFRITDNDYSAIAAGEQIYYYMEAETAFEMWHALEEITDKIEDVKVAKSAPSEDSVSSSSAEVKR